MMARSILMRGTLPLLFTKVLLLLLDLNKECSGPPRSDAVLPVQVFYASASCANVLGKRKSAWLFKGIAPGPKLNSQFRLLTALRLLLLIVAGDIETNPGPPMMEVSSFPEGVPVPQDSLLTNYPCVKCALDTDGYDCVQCGFCMNWEHNTCSSLTRSMATQIGKYPNIAYLCDNCKDAGVLSIFRRVRNKLNERGILLGKLLDIYDAWASTAANPPKNPVQNDTIDAETQTEPNDATTTPNPTTSIAPEADQSIESPVIEVPVQLPTQPNSSEPEPEPDPVIVKGKNDPRSNFYRFNFTYGHITYKSLEHAYQSIKASMCGYANLAWEIRVASSPQVAKRLANRLPRIAMKDLHELMFDLLKAKISQCYSFRQSLRQTGNQRIFHSTYKDVDLYWCTGLKYDDIEGHKGDYDGLNVFGQMLEQIRDEYLLDEDNYETRMKYLEASDFVVLLHDGEDCFYPGIHSSDFYHRGSGYHRYRH
jgi:ribA/ribD-fused uncharacterized protein